jgi:hypothetical protein
MQEMENLAARVDGEVSLKQILDYFHLDSPDEIYKKGVPSYLLSEIKKGNRDLGVMKKAHFSLAEGFRNLLLMDDTSFVEEARQLVTNPASTITKSCELLNLILWKKGVRKEQSLETVNSYIKTHAGLAHDLRELLDWILLHKTPIIENKHPLTGSLNLHASYTREQIVLSLGKGTYENPFPSREGVMHVAERKADVFFADINKSEADFSPTTMYEDYAITDRLFHWQSQSLTSDTSPVPMCQDS